MTKEEALKLALEALEEIHVGNMTPMAEINWNKAITAIKEALAQPEQKPVAWVREHELPLAPGDAFSWVETFVHKTPLYTSPPKEQQSCDKRPWVGLTHDQTKECVRAWDGNDAYYLCRAIEAKLEELNT